jgi:hypothetical protein
MLNYIIDQKYKKSDEKQINTDKFYINIKISLCFILKIEVKI